MKNGGFKIFTLLFHHSNLARLFSETYLQNKAHSHIPVCLGFIRYDEEALHTGSKNSSPTIKYTLLQTFNIKQVKKALRCYPLSIVETVKNGRTRHFVGDFQN